MEKRNAIIGVHSSDLDAHQDGAVAHHSTASTAAAGATVAKVTS
jgi:hypothetical protein